MDQIYGEQSTISMSSAESLIEISVILTYRDNER